MNEGIDLTGQELEMLKNNKQGGYNYRMRRHDPWAEIYTLYRDEVVINRLIQRQSVNLPIMKLSLQTNLKDADQLPVIYFENLDNDKLAELFKNEYWRWTGEQNNFELQDIVDKKQEWLYGRTFDQWQVVDGKIKMTVEDPMDILVDRFCDPYNIHSARSLIHNHIYMSFAQLEDNPMYDQEAIAKLKQWHATEMGLLKNNTNTNEAIDKAKKMQDLGVPDVDNPIIGETIVELSLHFVMRKEGNTPEQFWLYVEADDQVILMKKPLEEVIGTTKDHWFRNHLPYCSWAGDVDRQDFWSDGKGDVVRTPNKVLNSWFSQMVENRNLKNYGMAFYDASMAADTGWTPQTFDPKPFGFYPVPTDPNKFLSQVPISDLSDSLPEIQFLITMMEKATGATATQQGVQTDRQVTLGEVQLALGQAQSRAKSWSKFYTKVWEERGLMFVKLCEAAADKLDAVRIFKKGKNDSTDIYSREIESKDWMSKSGYQVRIWNQDDKDSHDTDALQKVNAAKQAMPNNPKLQEIFQMKLLEYAHLTPEQVTEVMDFQRKQAEAASLAGPVNQTPQPGAQPTQPAQTTPMMAPPTSTPPAPAA